MLNLQKKHCKTLGTPEKNHFKNFLNSKKNDEDIYKIK